MKNHSISKRHLLVFGTSIIFIVLASFCTVQEANGSLTITSRLEIDTFWSDFVSLKWYLIVNLSDPNIRMVMIIPEDVITGNLSSAGVYQMPKGFDSVTNLTTFSIEGPVPLGTLSDDFPNDKYEANYFIGCNFLSQNSTFELGGNIPGPTDNYQASWSLRNDNTFASQVNQIPSFALNDIGNVTCWLKLSLSIFHRPPFASFVGVLVNQVPLWLGIFGGFMAAATFASIAYDLLHSRPRRSKRVTMIEGIIIPISAAVIVFVPVYLLALHAFEAPLLTMKVENNLINLLIVYVAILVVGIALRAMVSTPETVSEKAGFSQSNNSIDIGPKPEPSSEKNNGKPSLKEQMQIQRLISELSTRENSTLVVSTIAASVSLAVLAVAMQSTGAPWFGSAFVMGFAFSLLSFLYRETTILFVDSKDYTSLNSSLRPTAQTIKVGKTATSVRMFIMRFLLLMPMAAWVEVTLPQDIQVLSWIALIAIICAVSSVLTWRELRLRNKGT
jgi:hypothetical protein